MSKIENWLPPEEYYKTLPRKTVASAVIFRNAKDELLIMKPTYKEGWIFVGGVTESNESPSVGATREAYEETGLKKGIKSLVCVDHMIDNKTIADDPKTDFLIDHLAFIFDGGVLTEEEIGAITIEKDEISEYRFVSVDKAKQLLRPSASRRLDQIMQAIDTGTCAYLENGKSI